MAKRMPLPPEVLGDSDEPKFMPGFAGVVAKIPEPPPRPPLPDDSLSNATSSIENHNEHAEFSISTPLETRALDSNAPAVTSINLDIALVRPSPFQVRVAADSDYIESLMSSIAQSGVISPLVVRPVAREIDSHQKKEALESNVFEIIAGHHRYEACRRLGYLTVPVVVREMDDADAAKALASDNLVRKDLCDFERYKHAKMLRDLSFCKTNTEIGTVLGISRPLVSFLFAFEKFPVEAQALLEKCPGILGATQANDYKDLAVSNPDLFTEALKLVSESKLQQTKVRPWIESQIRSEAKSSVEKSVRRRKLEIKRPGMEFPIRLVYGDGDAYISAPSINIKKLQELIESNLDDLLQ